MKRMTETAAHRDLYRHGFLAGLREARLQHALDQTGRAETPFADWLVQQIERLEKCDDEKTKGA